MKEIRNPFRMRTAENLEQEQIFLKLFGEQVLDVLPENDLWTKRQIFSSAPGGGKTSILRLFTPSILLKLFELKDSDEYKNLYARMVKLNVFSKQGPTTLGVFMPCGNYASIEDLDFNSVVKKRLFFSLMNARLILTLMRGLLILQGAQYPDDLYKIKFDIPVQHFISPLIPVPCTGDVLYKWAYEIEKNICEIIDSFNNDSDKILEGYDSLEVLLLNPDYISYEGQKIVQRLVFMFDDINYLARQQRTSLLKEVNIKRPYNSIWIAQRLDALEPEKLMMLQNAVEGRDYNEIYLEDFWRKTTGHNKFENILKNIADRRISLTRDFHMHFTSFEQSLKNTLDGSANQEIFKNIVDDISERVKEKVNTIRYDKWVNMIESKQGDSRNLAIEWKTLEIAINRDNNKRQIVMDFGQPLSEEDFDNIDKSSIRNAAELYISQEFNIPYYFGMRKLANLSSSNIDQFLSLAGDLFEEILTTRLVKRTATLDPKRQEAILKKAAKKKWEEIEKRLPNGRNAQKLLEAIGRYANWYWKRETASYGAGGGITGFALTDEECEKLLKVESSASNNQLLYILSSCIANNLLELAKTNQGYKGRNVFYLNRWLCLHFNLPLQYGGFKNISIKKLNEWLDSGFKPSKKGGELFD